MSEHCAKFVYGLDPNAPSECEGGVRVDYYSDGDDPNMDDHWEYEQEEQEWEYPWEEHDWEEQSARDTSMEFEMGVEDNTTGSSSGPFPWLHAAWSSRFWGRPAQRDNMVGGEAERGKGGSSTSWHRDPQDGEDAGGMGREVPGKGVFQAKGSKGAH